MKYMKYLVPCLLIAVVPAMATSLGSSGMPAGTTVAIRLVRALSSDRNRAGEEFTASLAQSVIVQGRVIARQGSAVKGLILRASGRNSANGDLVLQLTELVSGNGWVEPIASEPLERRTVARSTGGAGWNLPAMGTTIGAVLGKGRGAALGTAIGTSVRGLAAADMRAQPVVIQPNEVLLFRLR